MSASLHFTEGSLLGETIVLTRPETRIGRDPGADLAIPVAGRRFVSRSHAVVRLEGGRYVVEDLGSTNGTWVNGGRIQRAVLSDGDEIRFGREGPAARFRTGDPRAEAPTVVAADAWQGPAAAPGPSQPTAERPSQLVRRLVREAVAQGAHPSRSTVPPLALWAGIAVALAVGATAYLGLARGTESTFRRLATEYEDRVLLVEVGVVRNGEYIKLGNGSGFVADDEGLILTNKHVVHGHLYSPGTACIAASYRRRGRSFEEALVVSAWQGGSRFRQSTNTGVGDRALGYSTADGTLRVAAVAPDNLGAPRTLQCSDFLGSGRFTVTWRPHAQDNNDLAVLRAFQPLPSIPLATREPRPDDPVMVYGFPSGVAPLETNHAEPMRRTGRVLRTRETIQIDAVVLQGNSGGPLIDGQGNVVGITTRGPAETLNMAIKVEYALRLLERAREELPP
jgi:S1-C subfamily serine protease